MATPEDRCQRSSSAVSRRTPQIIAKPPRPNQATVFKFANSTKTFQQRHPRTPSRRPRDESQRHRPRAGALLPTSWRGAPSDLCRKRQIACIGAMRRYFRICVCAFARPRTRLCDESPDGDLALPCPRHAQASPASRPRHRQPCGFHRIADHERRLRGTRMSTNRFTKPTALLSLRLRGTRMSTNRFTKPTALLSLWDTRQSSRAGPFSCAST